MGKKRADTVGEALEIYEASRRMRTGAASYCSLVDEPIGTELFLYGQGFEIRVTRTDPDAKYPGRYVPGDNLTDGP